jgi:phytanoyl-CoA hydroxylase
MDYSRLEKYKLWIDTNEAIQLAKQKNNAKLLTQFITDGYCVLPEKISPVLIDSAWGDLESALNTNFSVTCHKEGIGCFSSLNKDIVSKIGSRYSVHDFHQKSKSLLKIFTNNSIANFLIEAFGQTPILMQSQMFRLASHKGAHGDYVYQPFDNPIHSITCWIAGENISKDSGALFFYPRSHRLKPYIFPDGHLLWNGSDSNLSGMKKYHNDLENMCIDFGLEKKSFIATKGEVLVLNSQLVHGSSLALSNTITRKSFSLHFSCMGSFVYKNLPIYEESALEYNNGIAYNSKSHWSGQGAKVLFDDIAKKEHM